MAEATACGPAEVEEAIVIATRAAERWRRVPVADRAAVLFGAADACEGRNELAALQVREAGKGGRKPTQTSARRSTSASTTRRMLELDAGGAVQSPPARRTGCSTAAAVSAQSSRRGTSPVRSRQA